MSEVHVPKFARKGTNKNYLGKEENVIGKVNNREKQEKREGTSSLLRNPLRVIDEDGDQVWHSRALRRAFMNSPNKRDA